MMGWEQVALVVAQATDASDVGGIALQPFDPVSVVKIAVLNPFVWIVGFVMGRQADQWQKVLVAGFAAALVGYGAVWIATFVGLLEAKGIGSATGVFMIDFLIGMFAAWVGYIFARKTT